MSRLIATRIRWLGWTVLAFALAFGLALLLTSQANTTAPRLVRQMENS